jgi:hypothetical protein
MKKLYIGCRDESLPGVGSAHGFNHLLFSGDPSDSAAFTETVVS